MSLNDKEFMRYNRHVMLEQVGEQGQAKFIAAKVVIVGMGGLGCPASQYLAAAGVGELTLIDHDIIETSNLQRQILFSDADLGKPKVKVAKTRLLQLNPLLHVDAIKESVFECDFEQRIKSADVVLDCTDNPKTRKYINQACFNAQTKLVSASAIQGAGQLISFDFAQPNSPCYSCLFPEGAEQSLSCSTSGVFSPLLGIMGSMQAADTLNLLLGNTDTLNKLSLFDVWGRKLNTFNLPKDSNCAVCGTEKVKF